jgi:tetratricopeptide (TPR) repeat protein
MEQGHFLIYIIAAHADEKWREALERHLALFVKRYALSLWHSQMIVPGQDIRQMQQAKLRQASLVLLLVSADCFDTCDEEIALLAEHCPSTTVIPVLLRTYNLRFTPFSNLQSLPARGVPVTHFADRDEALQEVTNGICEAVLLRLAPEGKPQEHKEKKLLAMLADHSAFLNDRLRSFVGREQELAEVQARIAEQREQGGYITITGQAGQGKSSIIAKLVEYYGRETVASHFIPFRPGPDYQISLLRDLMARLILKHDLSDVYVAAESRAALRDYFLNLLRELSEIQRHEIIFLDGLDQIEKDLTGRRDLSFLPDQPPSGIVFVLGTRPDDTLHPLKLLSPHVEYQLPPMRKDDFERILVRRDVHLERGIIEQLHQALQENALYLDLAAKELHETGALSPQHILAQVASDPSNLFSLSIQRLRRNALEWREAIKPVLGILLVAQEPFLVAHLRQLLPALEDERLRDALVRLGGLLTMTGQNAYALFHLKFQDYLREDEARPHTHVFARDEEEDYHTLLAHWCERGGMAHIWEDIKDAREQFRRIYARRHYITHLYEARLDQQLFAVLDQGSYGQAKERLDRTTRSYTHDLDLGRKAATRPHLEQQEAIALLPVLWRYTLLRGSIKSQADHYPESLFEGMLLVHREADVLGIAELLTQKSARVALLLRIGLHLTAQSGASVASMYVFRRAQSIASTIEEADLRASALSKIGLALAKAGQEADASRVLTFAEEVARNVEQTDLRVFALSDIGLALVKAGQEKEARRVLTFAEEIVRSIKEVDLRASALSKIGLALAEAGQEKEARRVLTFAEEVARNIEQANLRAFALSQIGLALARAKLWEQAEKVARSIKQTSLRASALRHLGLALAEVKQWERAEKVARSIEQANLRAPVLSKISQTLAEAGQEADARRVLTSAEEVARNVEQADLRASALSDIGLALVKAGQEKEARRVLTSAEEVARSIEQANLRASALSDIGLALVKAGQEKEARHVLTSAEEVARSIEQANLKASALRHLGLALAEAGQEKEARHVLTFAEEVARSIEQADQRASALSKIGLALAEAGQEADARRVLTFAEEVARSIERAHLRTLVLSNIGQALARAKLWEQAEKVARSIKQTSLRASALRHLGLALAEAGQEADARRVLTFAEEVARSIKQADQRAFALRHLGLALVEAKQEADARRVLTFAEEVARSIKEVSLRIFVLSNLGLALAEAGQEADARRVLTFAEEVACSIEQTDLGAFALRQIGQTLTRAKLWEQAEKVARSIEEVDQRSFALSHLGLALAEAGQEADARRVLTFAEEVARSIKQADLRASALRNIGQTLARAKLWERAEEVARSIEQADLRASALRNLGQGLAETGQEAEARRILTFAEEVARSIEQADQRASALRWIGQTLARAKLWEQFIPFLQRTWISAETRSSALTVLPLIAPILVSHPSLQYNLLGSFGWVNAFLKGEEDTLLHRYN